MNDVCYEAGQIVVTQNDELWQLEHQVAGGEWGASNSTGDTSLEPDSFRLATPEEAENFKPSPL